MEGKKISQKILCRSSSSFLLFLCVTKFQNFATKEKIVGKKCFLSANHPSIHPSMLHGVLVDRRSTWEEGVSVHTPTMNESIHPSMLHGVLVDRSTWQESVSCPHTIHPSMLHSVLVDRRSTWEESVSCPHTIHQIIHPAWYTGGGGKGRRGEGRELILESRYFFEEF
jgi:hypothetical protein